MDVTRRALGMICGACCVVCPCVIGWLSVTYAETGFDADFKPWPLYAVDGLFWFAFIGTIGLIWSLRSWSRWLGAVVAIPMLALTGVLAVTGGMWIAGTYF